MRAALAEVRSTFGPVSALIWNAGSGVWGSIEEVTVEDLERAWQVNVRGLAAAVKDALPDLLASGGNVIVVGATASLRGGARFAAFASAKAAQRSLAQSMARHLGPKGVHVSLLILDGAVATPGALQRQPDRDPETMIAPEAIAATALGLAKQPRSAWTFELDLRPSRETW